MANLAPTGIDLTTGQHRRLEVGDTLTKADGSPAVSSSGVPFGGDGGVGDMVFSGPGVLSGELHFQKVTLDPFVTMSVGPSRSLVLKCSVPGGEALRLNAGASIVGSTYGIGGALGLRGLGGLGFPFTAPTNGSPGGLPSAPDLLSPGTATGGSSGSGGGGGAGNGSFNGGSGAAGQAGTNRTVELDGAGAGTAGPAGVAGLGGTVGTDGTTPADPGSPTALAAIAGTTWLADISTAVMASPTWKRFGDRIRPGAPGAGGAGGGGGAPGTGSLTVANGGDGGNGTAGGRGGSVVIIEVLGDISLIGAASISAGGENAPGVPTTAQNGVNEFLNGSAGAGGGGGGGGAGGSGGALILRYSGAVTGAPIVPGVNVHANGGLGAPGFTGGFAGSFVNIIWGMSGNGGNGRNGRDGEAGILVIEKVAL